jgi:hypothetical protein
MQQVDVFVAPSRHIRERFVADGGVPPERMVLLGKRMLAFRINVA